MVTFGFSTLIQYFQSYGVMDFLLPFILVFTIIYAVTATVPLFKDQKNFRVIIALVLSLLFVVPHITGRDFTNAAGGWVALIAILFVVYIFGAAFGLWFGPYDVFSWWTTDVTELMVILLVFGVLIWWITKEPQKPEEKGLFDKLLEIGGKITER